jgi:hypothetical protein
MYSLIIKLFRCILPRATWLDTGFQLVIGFIGFLETIIKIHYSALANSRTLRFTIAFTESYIFALGVATQRLPTRGASSARVAIVSQQPQTRTCPSPSELINSTPESQSQSYVTTDGQSASHSVKPHLGPNTRFLLLSDSCGFLVWGVLSDERTRPLFTIAAGPRQRSHSRVRVPKDSRPWRVRSPYFYPPGTWRPGFTPKHWVPFRRLLWLAGRGIRTGLHTGYSTPESSDQISLYSVCTDTTEDTTSNNSSIAAWVIVTTVT